MKRVLIALTLTTLSAVVTFKVLAACGSYFQSHGADTFDGGPCPTAFYKEAHWDLFFTDGHSQTNPPVNVREAGACWGPDNGVYQACYPGFDTPFWMETTVGKWNQVTHDPSHTGPGAPCQFNGPITRDHIFTYCCKAQCRGVTDYQNYTTGCIGAFTDGGGICGRTQTFINKCYQYGEGYNDENCSCEAITPILIDVTGNGFSLTDAANGVSFDLEGSGTPNQFAWTSPGSDDAFLALDRNGNGSIDNGQELFGNVTRQPAAPEGEQHNGFIALAMFDSPDQGGNNDHKISEEDVIFPSLLLWQDSNHNGFSEPNELHSLQDLGLKSINLDYKLSRRTDRHGNWFRYRAKVTDANDAQLGRWVWDVILVKAP